jgi:hypothetical protein
MFSKKKKKKKKIGKVADRLNSYFTFSAIKWINVGYYYFIFIIDLLK